MNSPNDLLSSYGQLLTDPKLIHQIKSRISLLCKTRSPDVFPGGQPVSFQQEHISNLLNEDYYVCEKSDGIRLLLFCIEGGLCFFINRKYEIRFIQGLSLPTAVALSSASSQSTTNNSRAFQHETLLDGELLADLVVNSSSNSSSSPTFQLKFSIFDVILVEGQSQMHLSLNDRLSVCLKKVIIPYEQHLQRQKQREQPSMVPILQLKAMHKSYGLEEVLNKVIPALNHENDGLIFTPLHCPYQIGTWPSLLKWKPAHLNSVDFCLGYENDSAGGGGRWFLQASKRGNLCFWDWLFPVDAAASKGQKSKDEEEEDAWWQALGPGAILECVWDSERIVSAVNEKTCTLNGETFLNGETSVNGENSLRGGWKPLRQRLDKQAPNEVSVIESILKSIEQGVTKEQLIAQVPAIRERYRKRNASKEGAK